MKKNYCKCEKEIHKTSKRCIKCHNSGKNARKYIDGRSLEKYYCKCGKLLSNYRAKKCPNCSVRGRKLSKEHCETISKNAKKRLAKPENNPNWREGISFEEYGSEFDNNLKEQVRFRDKYKCQMCGCPQIENSKQLDVHHKDYNKKNNKLNNLVALCRSCHIKTNYNREYWLIYFRIIKSNSTLEKINKKEIIDDNKGTV